MTANPNDETTTTGNHNNPDNDNLTPSQPRPLFSLPLPTSNVQLHTSLLQRDDAVGQRMTQRPKDDTAVKGMREREYLPIIEGTETGPPPPLKMRSPEPNLTSWTAWTCDNQCCHDPMPLCQTTWSRGQPRTAMSRLQWHGGARSPMPTRWMIRRWELNSDVSNHTKAERAGPDVLNGTKAWEIHHQCQMTPRWTSRAIWISVLISFLWSLIGPVRFFEVLGLWWTGLGLGLSPWRSKTETGPDFQSLHVLLTSLIVVHTLLISLVIAACTCCIICLCLIINLLVLSLACVFSRHVYHQTQSCSSTQKRSELPWVKEVHHTSPSSWGSLVPHWRDRQTIQCFSEEHGTSQVYCSIRGGWKSQIQGMVARWHESVSYHASSYLSHHSLSPWHFGWENCTFLMGSSTHSLCTHQYPHTVWLTGSSLKCKTQGLPWSWLLPQRVQRCSTLFWLWMLPTANLKWCITLYAGFLTQGPGAISSTHDPDHAGPHRTRELTHSGQEKWSWHLTQSNHQSPHHRMSTSQVQEQFSSLSQTRSQFRVLKLLSRRQCNPETCSQSQWCSVYKLWPVQPWSRSLLSRWWRDGGSRTTLIRVVLVHTWNFAILPYCLWPYK